MKLKVLNLVFYCLIGIFIYLHFGSKTDHSVAPAPVKNGIPFNDYFESVIKENIPEKYAGANFRDCRECSGLILELPENVKVCLIDRGPLNFGIDRVEFQPTATQDDKRKVGRKVSGILETLKKFHINAFEQGPDSFTIFFNRAYIDQNTIPTLIDSDGGPLKAQCFHFVKKENLIKFLKTYPLTCRLNDEWYCGLY